MPQYILDSNGNERWVNDKYQFHREDGPAIIWSNGSKFWYLNGQRHREDGPAIEWNNGDKFWYYYDKCISCSSQEEFLKIIKLKAFW